MLEPGEPEPFNVIECNSGTPALVVCDHASNRIPLARENLGLSRAELSTHFALDIGAYAVAQGLSERLRLPAISAAYSRLVVDCNRRLDHPTAFPESMGQVPVPGNQRLSHFERQLRADVLYWPYHHAVRDRLRAMEILAPAPALVAVHSFTPSLYGQTRPWHIGILWDNDPRIPVPLINALRALPGLVVGDNEPYSGKSPFDFTIDHHGEGEGLPHVSIELRQDLIDTEEGADQWAAVLAEALQPILDDERLFVHWTQ